MNNRLIIMINHLNPQWNRSTVCCLMQVSNAERVIDDVRQLKIGALIIEAINLAPRGFWSARLFGFQL